MIHGDFDYNQTPLPPPGCKITIDDRAGERRTWAEHVSRVFYAGPAMEHYRNCHCYLLNTKSTRVSNTVEFFHHQFQLPQMSLQDHLEEKLSELVDLLQAKKNTNELPPSAGLNKLHRFLTQYRRAAPRVGTRGTRVVLAPTSIRKTELQHLQGWADQHDSPRLMI